jgi:hypothetical protein
VEILNLRPRTLSPTQAPAHFQQMSPHLTRNPLWQSPNQSLTLAIQNLPKESNQKSIQTETKPPAPITPKPSCPNRPPQGQLWIPFTWTLTTQKFTYCEFGPHENRPGERSDPLSLPKPVQPLKVNYSSKLFGIWQEKILPANYNHNNNGNFLTWHPRDTYV